MLYDDKTVRSRDINMHHLLSHITLFSSEFLNTIRLVTYIEVSQVVHSDCQRMDEFTVFSPWITPGSQKITDSIEDLDSICLWRMGCILNDIHITLRIYGDPIWIVELTGFFSKRTPFGKKGTLVIELLDAVISKVRDIYIPLGIYCQSARVVELAVTDP